MANGIQKLDEISIEQDPDPVFTFKELSLSIISGFKNYAGSNLYDTAKEIRQRLENLPQSVLLLYKLNN